jgi:hypothetical protein
VGAALVMLGFGGALAGCGPSSRAAASRKADPAPDVAVPPKGERDRPVMVMYGVRQVRYDPNKPLSAVTNRVTGSVTDAESGEPMPGATVTVMPESSGRAALAGIDGYYSIAADRGDTLRFNFPGYLVEKATVAGDELNVRMKPDTARLNITVVTMYGVRSARYNPGKQVSIVTGRVTGENGEPLQYVNVSVTDGSAGVVTDRDGRYTIQADKGDELRFSHHDMLTKTIKAGRRGELNVRLKKD